MTEPLDPNAGHLDLETLADLDEGLLDPQQAEAARAHVDGCAQCRDDLAALTSVRDLLAADAADLSLTMPDDVADRLHAALAAEPALTPPADHAEGSADAPAAPPYAPVVVTTLPQRPTGHRGRNQLLGGLAAAAVIALFALGISVLPHGSSSESKAGSAAATSAAPAVAATSSGRDYTKAGLGNQALALIGRATPSSAAAASSSAAPASAAAAGTSAAATSAAASAAASAAGSSAPASSASSSSAASSSTLASATAGSQKSPANDGNEATSAAATPTADVLAPLRKPGAAQACLSSYASQAGAPLAIDFATFDGKPAVIGVFNDPNLAGRFEVVAVGPPGCSLYEFVRPNPS